MNKNRTYIPIGIDCSIAHYLRAQNIRHQAFPFDWNVTPINVALNLIENKFEGFLDLPNLEFLPPVKRLLFEEDGITLKSTNDIITPVVCRRYGILFPHDFSEAGVKDYQEVKSKYERRIENLLRKLSSGEGLEFIYSNGSPNKWQNDQFRKAGVEFLHCDDNDMMKGYQALQIENSKITSLSGFKWERMSWDQRCKNIYNRIKQRLS